MYRKKLISICMIVCLAGLSGCGSKNSGQSEKETAVPKIKIETEESAAAAEGTGGEKTQDSSADDESVGQGFKPPEGSHVDSKGNIVDPQGNTFNQKGQWQVPEGGHMDSKGRIIDKDGNVMGGGAPVGSVG